MSSDIKQIYAAFAPTPLTSGQADLYVDLDAARGDTEIVRRVARKIRLADAATCQVITGHPGSGKSTELFRLQHHLQEADDAGERYFVVLVRADDHMDRNDVDFPEVLIAIIRQLATDLRERLKVELQPGYFRDRWERLKDLAFSEVELDGIKLDAGMATLAGTIKHSPDARLEVRKLLEPDTTNWVHAANDVIGTAKQELQKKGYRDLVIVVDDLDKIITRVHPSAECTTTEHLFVHRAAQMTAFECHVVYTLPLELAYSHHEQAIEARYGGELPVIPMTKTATPPPALRAHRKGIDLFREIIANRLKSVDATHADLFHNKSVETSLIKLSGGQPTELMTLIREAIISGDLPIKAAALRRCHEDALRTYQRQLRPEHWPLLLQARTDGRVVPSKDNEPAFRELLQSRALLLYRNDREWYGLHPALHDLEPPVISEPPAESDADANGD